jgi:hypothetical protein
VGGALLGAVACSRIEAFPGSAASLDDLGRGVLEALAAGDSAALEDFRLSEAEHNDVVWPELPASAPEVSFPVDMAWLNIHMRNRSALVRISPFYEGRSPTYGTTECRGDTERFETFDVLTDCWVLFEIDGDAGRLEAQLFKDVLVRGGGYKIFRYYDEAPSAPQTMEAD